MTRKPTPPGTPKPAAAEPVAAKRAGKPTRGSFAAAIKPKAPDAVREPGHTLVDDLAAHASPLSLIHPAEPAADVRPIIGRAARPTRAAAPSDGREKAPAAPRRTPVPPPKPPAAAEPAAGPEAAAPAAIAAATNGRTISANKPAPDAATPTQSPPEPASATTSPPPPGNERKPQPEHQDTVADSTSALGEAETFARNMALLIENSGKAAAAYLQPREKSGASALAGTDIVQTMNSLGKVAESWLGNPARMLQAQAALSTQLFSLWNTSLARLNSPAAAGEKPVADKRFAAPEWRETPFFDFLHQAYLVTTDWAKTLVTEADGVDEATRDQAGFYLRQIASALSPSNYLATNPELLKGTLAERGENLVRGMKMLAEDIEAGKGDLKIRQTDATRFELGVDMATTPGKVVFRNDLMELIQYAPSTTEVLKRPLLIVPPWINKFYVLDLNKEKSFIRWAVSEGLTVFVISWVNPDERHAAKDWDAYMREGIFAALDAVEQATGERDVSTVGYCVGGTLLAATLAYMAATNDRRVSSSTFLTTQVDFKEAGDLKVFADEAQIRTVERQMAETGYLAGSRMANAFNMLRPDDLIWSYSVNTYLKGQQPRAFDLLTWNADSTRMSAANHAFYLRNCYLENNLTRGEMVIGGRKLNLADVTVPIYDLATKEDHIAPARSVFNGAKSFGGPVRYVMAGSGHIAGVVNPPVKAKYQYWTDGRTDGSFEQWIESATETPGTWWLDWIGWLRDQAPVTVPARQPGDGGLKLLGDAPGEYVRVKC